MTKRRWLYLVETLGSITWFAMDACWMLSIPWLALALAAPTLLLNGLAIHFSPRKAASMLVAAAMAAWAAMNVLWMMGDLAIFRHGLVCGRAFLLLGVAMLVAAMVMNRAETFRDLLGRFRRLRLRA